MSEYLTTKELAKLLRIKERKVYDLAASGKVPCSRAMGKLLFPREAVDAWLVRRSSGLDGLMSTPLPSVFLGSHDPLLEWALRQSQCGIATYFDSSLDGIARFAGREGLATGLHLYDAKSNDWNVPVVREHCGMLPVVLVEWSKRQRGLILGNALDKHVSTVADLKGRRIVPRQAEAGAQALMVHVLTAAGLAPDDLDLLPPVLTEVDAALAVLEGKADATFGLAALAAQCRLPFVPVMEERFDLVVDRRGWFEPPMQRFMDFCQTPAFVSHAADLDGYDISGFGTVHFNAP